jgi:DNA polymerase-3 subunit alpha
MVLNKKVLESLARAGALDKLAERNQILAGMEIILKFIQNQNKKRASAQLGLFGQKQSESTSIVNFLPKVPPADKNQRLLWEKELLGMYISEHPLSEYQELWDSDKVMKISSLSLFSQEDIVCVAGVVNKIQRIRTRKESEMAFVTLEDFSGQIEVVVFPKVYEKYAHLLYKDAIVVVIGRAGEKEGVVKILAEKIQNINDVMRVKKAVAANNQSPKQKKLYLTLSNDHRKETLNAIKAIIEAHPGEAEVILRLPYNGQYKEVRIKQRITISPELLAALSKLIGKENLKEKG